MPMKAMLCEVVPLTKENDRDHIVDIAYSANKGSKVQFERIAITGKPSPETTSSGASLKCTKGNTSADWG